jgi:hypothetical protein
MHSCLQAGNPYKKAHIYTTQNNPLTSKIGVSGLFFKIFKKYQNNANEKQKLTEI